MRKIVLVIEKNFLKFEAEGREFSKISRLIDQFIQTVKDQHTYFKKMARIGHNTVIYKGTFVSNQSLLQDS